jgi:hypothetical protein
VEKADAAFGDGFGIADKDGPALPGGPSGEPHSFWAGVCDGLDPTTAVGSSPAQPRHCIDWGVPYWDVNPWVTPPAWRLAPVTAAGAHPDGTATFALVRSAQSQIDGSLENATVELPPGVVGDPNALPKCSADDFEPEPVQCPPETQVGILEASVLGGLGYSEFILPVYNLEPRPGRTAEFGIPDIFSYTSVRIVGQARTDGDFGVSALAHNIPSPIPVFSQSITLWGVPWAAEHDRWRVRKGFDGKNLGFLITPPRQPIFPFGIPEAGLTGVDPSFGSDHANYVPQSYDPSWGPIKPFFSNLTECDSEDPVTVAKLNSFQDPTDVKSYASLADAGTGCEQLPFDPEATFQPTAIDAGGPTGLAADITIPQNNEPPADVADDPDDATGAPAHWRSDAGRATAHLDKTVVALPKGMSVNPSAAAGLQACTNEQMGVTATGNPYTFDDEEPTCPDASKIGTVEATTPLLEGSPNMTGEVILGMPETTNPQGEADGRRMFRIFLVLRNQERGLLAKIYGTSVASGGDGQLTATFDKNPRVPVESIKVDLKGGERGILALPQGCGEKTTASEFTPWTAAHGGGGPVRSLTDSFTVGGDCSFGFAPTLAAGMDTQIARANGKFSFRFSRQDGEQWLRGLTAKLPPGLLASVKEVDLCSDAQANAGACPLGSQIGIVDAKAGAGNPFVLEQKGRVYLTEGYKGGEYGLAVKIRPVAGPFRGALELSPIIVRQAIHVDRKTAQVTAVSDPFPLIHHGVPLRVREVTVLVDRGNFMLNPSDCSTKQVGADILSAEGTTAAATNPFQASGCAALPFKPRLGLRMTGRRQTRTGRHPGIRALVRQNGVGEAGIQRAEVRLPKTLALDVDNAQALCEFEDGTKPDLENHCPKGSIVGRARAQTPLLNDDLVGNVYFVKNVRIDPDTGNEIRTLPMIIAALRGEIAVNLVGESDVKGGKLVSTFANIPDAPISRFNMNIRGGKNGIVAVTRTRRSLINLCSSGRQIAEADMDGQNGKRHDFNVNMRKPCPRRRPSAAAVCRKRTNTKPALRRCVRRVKANRAKAAKRKAAAKRKQAAAKRRNTMRG